MVDSRSEYLIASGRTRHVAKTDASMCCFGSDCSDFDLFLVRGEGKKESHQPRETGVGRKGETSASRSLIPSLALVHGWGGSTSPRLALTRAGDTRRSLVTPAFFPRAESLLVQLPFTHTLSSDTS